ncbi:MAG: glycogen-binding domain-containing protein [Desulfobacterales bacterium]
MNPNPSPQKLKKRRVTFSLTAPDAEQVAVAGTFNGWDEKAGRMKGSGPGVWQKIVMLPPGDYEYKFVVDGEWLTDPRNPEIRSNCFGTFNSFLRVAAK